MNAPVPFTVPPMTGVARVLLDRDGFAGEHGFVDPGGAVDHLAVDRDALAGADADEVAGEDLGDGDLHASSPRATTRAVRGLQRHEAADGFAGAALGAGLERAAEQDEGDDDGGGFEIDVGRAFGQQAGREGGHDREVQAASVPMATSAFMSGAPRSSAGRPLR